MHNLTGTLESRSSDGNVTIDGKMSGVQVHTSDGSLDLTLAEGSQLTTASRVEASDGNVKIRLPKTLAADIDLHTGDGHIDCQLPLTMNGYNSGSGHTISGKLNAGGTPLTIHTRDGNLTVGPREASFRSLNGKIEAGRRTRLSNRLLGNYPKKPKILAYFRV